MKKAVLLTTHLWNSKRRAGFHWIADSLLRNSWEVCFATKLTYLEKFRNDYRFDCVNSTEFNRLIYKKNNLYTYVGFTPLRPIRAINRLTTIYDLIQIYIAKKHRFIELETYLADADLIIFESSYWLLKIPKYKSINPSARIVYRVSDDIEQMGYSKYMLSLEQDVAAMSDIVSSPSISIHNKFISLPNAHFHTHCIPKHMYDQSHNNPYENLNKPKAIFAGNILLDYHFINRAADNLPNVEFHIFGNHSNLISKNNLFVYGEHNYENIIPYIKYADLGLNCLTRPGFAFSGKTIQYTYCKLPIVMSKIDINDIPYYFFYEPGNDASIVSAITEALRYDRSLIPWDQVQSWDSLALRFINDTK